MTPNLQELPSVDQVLAQETTVELLKSHRREYVVGLVRESLGVCRQRLLAGTSEAKRADLVEEVNALLRTAIARGDRPKLHRVINATGIILHTGLGRAPLPAPVMQALEEVATTYCNLELDLDSGDRGSRLSHVDELICTAAGAEGAAVVNNNAAAVLLILDTLARGRHVLVSRGQLVEIGGSFRIPDIISSSGARIREVGTTNRTHVGDYANAIDDEAALILVVHPSNYRVQGFTSAPDLRALVQLSTEAKIPLVFDLGGGVVEDLAQWGLPYEPVVRDALNEGVDLVSFSGDKVLGGPQSGIIAGRRKLVDQVVANPMMRALRCDKLTLAALEATLKLYLQDPEKLRAAHPVLRMMTEPLESIERRAQRLVAVLPPNVVRRLRPSVVESTAQAGSGALPLEELASCCVSFSPVSGSGEQLARALRTSGRSVVGRIQKDQVLLDMRTVSDEELPWIAEAVQEVVEEQP